MMKDTICVAVGLVGGFFTALFTEITFILQPYHTVCKQLMIYVDFTVFSPEYDRYKIRLDI